MWIQNISIINVFFIFNIYLSVINEPRVKINSFIQKYFAREI